MRRRSISRGIVMLSILAVIAMSATAAAQPVPSGFHIAGSANNYCTGEPVNGATVTVKNLNTSDVFTTGTGQLFWWANYRIISSEDVMSAGNVLHFTASDNQGNSTEGNYTLTQEDTFYRGFMQDITIGVCGDASCDGDVDTLDAAIARYYSLSETYAWAADVNCDGVDMLDAAIIEYCWLTETSPNECCIGSS